MKPHLQGQSPMPKVHSGALAGMQKEVLERAFFSTSSGDMMRTPYSTSDSDLAKLARGESMRSINGQSGGSMPGNAKHLPDRSSCTYASTFFQKPLSDAKTVREMGIFFAEQAKGFARPEQQPKLSSQTTNREFYCKYGKKNFAGARGPSYKPEQPLHIDPSAHFLETRTCTARSYQLVDAAVVKRLRSEPARPPPNTLKADNIGPVVGRTSYKREFSASKLNFRPGGSGRQLAAAA
eukprot:TRINITY_DN46526_c0_g1_i1.p1 TRINITY_DN46526_c0_g1~~TRINITY_DN46526_c0_g1_i1.p1  ORF type:complete len:271 (+),score=56.68 TRINITY_DN46526_c0_g1_i1:103-813(+)